MKIDEIELKKRYKGEVLSGDSVKIENLVGRLKKPTNLEKGTGVIVEAVKIQYPDKLLFQILGRNTHKFIADSRGLDKLRPSMQKAADLIKKAIKNSKIILKHHADCDGYAGAIALERAIYPILKSEKRDFWRHYSRTPLKTPYYDYRDVLRDITNSYDIIEDGKNPLIIVLDTGSSEKDIFSLKKAKAYSCRTIVIDHHQPYMIKDKYPTQKITDVFINPYVVGGDSNLTAGMLGAEMSRMIADTKVAHLAAVAGYGDKSEGPEFKQYIKKSGYTKEQLMALAKCVDFEAYHLRYQESRIVEDILFHPDKRKVSLIINEINKREKSIIEKVKSAKTQKIGSANVYYILNISERGEYPPQGRATGIAFENIRKEDKVVLGISEDSVTIRTDHRGFDVNELIDSIDSPDVKGGGHEFAGTLHFPPGKKEFVIEKIEEYLR